MPAINAKAPAQSIANVDVPASGAAVNYSPFSGPQNSPFDARTIASYGTSPAYEYTWTNDTSNLSTGALNTGIGFGTTPIFDPTAPATIKAAGFNDDYTPGVTLPDGTAATTSILTCIGGGKSTANDDGIAPTVPYNAQPLLNMGNGGARDAGVGPVYTGFAEKTVTASGTVAVGAVVETGFVNRSNRSIVTGESVFGSATAASAAVA